MNDPFGFQRNRKLSEVTTLGIGGVAQFFVEVKEISHLLAILQFCRKENLPYLVLGRGSNCLFDDRGFAGVVIANKIDFSNFTQTGVFHVGAGYSFSLLGAQTARRGWSGLEFASGIPGSVGGAIYMNAGANGAETCHCLISVDYIDDQGICLTIPRSELAFSYRYSSFQSWQGAIVGATFALEASHTARTKQLSMIDYRKKTQPYGQKTAGCVFRNPSLTDSAGALIERMGLKGLSIGETEVSLLHANFLVNKGQASSKDLLALIEIIKKEVKEKTGIDLETEIRYIPYRPIKIKEEA